VGDSHLADNYTFFCGNRNVNHQLRIDVHKGIISSVKRVEFISNWMSYITLRGRWCYIIVLKVHAPTENKNDDTCYIFYEELERVLDQFRSTI
jgi:hypothetical protein